MTVQYYPKLDDNGNKLRDFAVAVLLPDAYSTSRQWPWFMAVHGIGERSQGKKENLENLVLGQLQPDGRRLWPFVKEDMKIAVDKYGIVMFVPTYENFFEPALVNMIYDFGRATFSLVDKFGLTGFSLGGGATVKDMTSTTGNAGRLAVAMPCAPTYNIVDASVVGKTQLPVHFFVNIYDSNGATNLATTKNQVTAINNTNPPIRVQYTAFDKAGHGGFDEAMTIAPPKAPNGQGVTDLSENFYEWYLDVLKNGPRPMRTGTPVPPLPTTTTTTTKAPTSAPVAEFNLVNGQVITTETFQADGSASKNVRTDWEGYAWGVRPILGSWGAKPEGGMYGGPLKKIIGLLPGTYEISLTVTSPSRQTDKKTVVITVKLDGPPTKKVISFDSVNDLITYADGTSEKGVATYAGGVWVLKTTSGQIIELP
jgi:hypothetical protein